MTRKPTRPKTVKVWHIFRFAERYELPDKYRRQFKGPLEYCREFVGSGRDNEAANYHNQMMQLRAQPDYHFLRGVFVDLREKAAAFSLRYRGYLLDAKFRPASVSLIAKWLGLEVDRTKSALASLSAIDLIERVPLPDFQQLDDDGTETTSERQLRTSRPAKPRQRRPRRNSGRSAQSCAEVRANENGNEQQQIEKPNEKRMKDSSHTLQSQAQEQATTTPTTTPVCPPRSDADQPRLLRFSGAGRSANPQHIGDILSRSSYDVDCKDFGYQIYQALQVPHDPASLPGRQELGCLASAWQKARTSGIPPPWLDKLRTRAIAEAQKIGRRRNRYQRPERLWRHIFGQLLLGYGDKTTCSAV